MINENKYWETICAVHFLTKHYQLIGEEFATDNDLFLQPMKEHRDAYDHIIRVYGYKMNDDVIDNIDDYRSQNFDKALGHEYRAFFDMADWLSIICRKGIRLLVENKSKEEILKVYPQYENIKRDLLTISENIALIREGKDVAKNMLSQVEEYREILDRLLQAYKDLSKIFG